MAAVTHSASAITSQWTMNFIPVFLSDRFVAW
jgi:hypothetical protein